VYWRIFIALLAASASGCAIEKRLDPIPQEGALTKRITWVISEDPHADCQKMGGKVLLYRTLGCASWKDPQHCVTYTRAPRNQDDRRAIETIGHEVLHCFAGHFHHRLN
jgi:hypothetical protein